MNRPFLEQHSSGRYMNVQHNYLIPNTHLNNPHFPSANGYTSKPGMGRCNYTGMMADAISKKTWEENVSEEQYLKTKARILKLIEKYRTG